jgi:hypothetical protein
MSNPNVPTEAPLIEVPVELPHVLITVADTGTLTVAVNGEPHTPPPFAPPWDRSTFGTVVDDLLAAWGCPLRVEVREADGTTFTDIITPKARRARHEQPTPTALPRLVELAAAGFIPGEDVAVAVVVGHNDASGEGTARALLDTTQLAGTATGEVILLGRISGAVFVGRPA